MGSVCLIRRKQWKNDLLRPFLGKIKRMSPMVSNSKNNYTWSGHNNKYKNSFILSASAISGGSRGKMIRACNSSWGDVFIFVCTLCLNLRKHAKQIVSRAGTKVKEVILRIGCLTTLFIKGFAMLDVPMRLIGKKNHSLNSLVISYFDRICMIYY